MTVEITSLPMTAEAASLLQRAIAHRQAGQLPQAIDLYQQILNLQPDQAHIWYLLGKAMQQQGQRAEAIDHFQHAITLIPQHPEFHLSLGTAWEEQDQVDRAIAAYETAYTLQTDSLNACVKLGSALEKQGRLERAIQHYQQAIGRMPHHAMLHQNLGAVLHKQGQLIEAIEAYRQAITLQPNYAKAYLNLGTALHHAGQTDDAIEHYQRAIVIQPDFALAYDALGTIYLERNQIESALQAYQQAIMVQPDYAEGHFNRAIAELLAGNLPTGFIEYEWRWQSRGGPPPHTLPQPLWDGSELHGQSILLYAEQGFGDAIQFVRYIFEVQRRGGRVSLGCPQALQRLFQSIPGVEQVSDTIQPANFQIQAPLMSLPRILGTTLDTIPVPIPYLEIERLKVIVGDRAAELASMIQSTHSASSPTLKVGIVWAGSVGNRGDRSRSCGFQAFLPLLDCPGVTFFSLQKGDRVTELEQWSETDWVNPVVNLDPHLHDFADTAIAIAHLDLVISVDTAVVHLAGALGKPVWVLLGYHPDWRWLLNRDDSPWYPTARLFRQHTPGNWQEVFQRVRSALSHFEIESRDRHAIATPQWHHSHSDTLNRALQAHQSGQWAEAEKLYRQLLDHHHQPQEVLQLLGTLYCQQERYTEGADYLERALRLKPDFAQGHFNRGIALHHLQQWDGARESFQRAIAIQPNYAEAHVQLGVLFKQQQQIEQAIHHFQWAIAANPDCVSAYHYLGNVYQERSEWDQAISHYRQAISLKPDSADLYNNLGAAFLCRGDAVEAMEYYQQAIVLDPTHPAAHYNLARAFQLQNQLPQAIQAYRKAIALKSDYVEAHVNLSLALLLVGDFQAGFEHYEWRWHQSTGFEHPVSPESFHQPMWDGSLLQGKTILVYCEQGYGDAIQFVRYLPQVAQRDGRILFECPKALVGWFQQLRGIESLIPRGSKIPEFDVHIPLLTLPALLGTTPDTIPADVPYLRGEVPETAQQFQSIAAPTVDSNFQIGLVWSTLSKSATRQERSLELSHILPWLSVPKITFYSLQKELSPVDAALLSETPIQDLRPHLGDFADTAAIVAELDLVITVDTAVAHVAGALGKPVWILLPYIPDWRWGLDRNDCPWYPTATLFRQSQPGNWRSAIDAIHQQLTHLSLQDIHAYRLNSIQSFSVHPVSLPLFSVSCTPIADFESSSPLASMPDLHTQILHAFQLHQSEQFDAAESIYLQVLQFDSNHIEALQLLGTLYCQQKRYSEGVEYLKRALLHQPNFAEGHYNLAAALQHLERSNEAIAYYRQALALKPDYPEAWLNLGNIYKQQEDWAAARTCYQQAIAARADYAKAWRSLGTIYQAEGDFATAIQHYHQALDIQPDYADAYSSWGYSLIEMGQLDAAMERYNRAIAYDPEHVDAHFGQAAIQLRQGNYHQGFEGYEWRWKYDYCPPRDFPQPLWNGEVLAGKTILLHDEQGLGDAMQSIRYVPLVKAKGGRILLECRDTLRRLFSTLDGIDQIVVRGQPIPYFDCHAPLMSLPRILGTTLETIPRNVPYLFVPPSVHFQLPPSVKIPESSKTTGVRIGIVWLANPINKTGRKRSCPLSLLEPIAALPQVQLYSLQKDPSDIDQEWMQQHYVIDLSEKLNDMADTAGAIAQLDLVITVDTAVAHLTGGMGKPVWILLPFMSDWRWLIDRDDSPWYPTARLFRQPQPNDWQALFTQLQEALVEGIQRQSFAVSPNAETLGSPTDLLIPLQQALEHYNAGELDKSEAIAQSLFATYPNCFELVQLLGSIAYGRQQWAKAEYFYRQLVIPHRSVTFVGMSSDDPSHDRDRVNTKFAEIYRNISMTLREQFRLDEAIQYAEQAITLAPNLHATHLTLGMAKQRQGDFDAALQAYATAQALQPDAAEVENAIGSVWYTQGDMAQAIDHYQQAIHLNPDYGTAHCNRAIVNLLCGNFVEGFAEYEWRWRAASWAANCPRRSFEQPRWDGTSLLNQSILLHCEQGLGDTIQFVRYVSLVKAKGGRVIVECQSSLKRLLSQISSLDQVIASGEPLPPFDVYAPLMSLPYLLDTRLDTVPAEIPYLRFVNQLSALKNTALITQFQTAKLQFPTAELRVGVVWAGNPTHWNDRQRSCPIEQFQQLLGVSDVAFFSLQKGDRTEPLPDGMIDLSPYLYDFADTAEAIAQLDLVITVDTSVAHLAGAMGKPVWILLSKVPDWRWLLDREDSPWYPTARLFRQTQLNHWQEVLERVISALEALKNEHRSPSVEISRGVISLSQPILLERWTDASQQFQAGQLQEAEQSCREFLQFNPNHIEALHLLGVILHHQDRVDDAIALYRQVVAINPNHAEAHGNLAILIKQQGDTNTAEDLYRKAITLNPNYAAAHCNLGNILQERKDWDGAIDCYQKALTIHPQYSKALNNLGNALGRTGKRSEAIAVYQKAIAIDPNYAEAYSNLANIYCEYGDLENGIPAHERALALKPDYAQSHQNYSIALLRLGDFAKGWAEFEWRWQLPDFRESNQRPHLQMPRWDGSDLNGQRLLIWSEQGYGDMIQFIRYVPLVRAKGGRVIVECFPALVPLLECLPDIDQVTSAALPQNYDLQIPIMSLGYVLQTTLETIPAQIPYLFPPSDRTVALPLPSGKRFRVGINWAAKIIHPTHQQRSIPLQDLSPLLNCPEVAFYSFQKEVPPSDVKTLQSLSASAQVQDLAPQLNDFADTAAAIAQMDWIITVDTAVAHLAGAMGKPVWILLSVPADWRWFLDRADSPWYPTATLFRQTEPGNWQPVITEVIQSLQAQIQSITVQEGLDSSHRSDQSQQIQTLDSPHQNLNLTDVQISDSEKSSPRSRKSSKKRDRSSPSTMNQSRPNKSSQTKAKKRSSSPKGFQSSGDGTMSESEGSPSSKAIQRSPQDSAWINKQLQQAVAYHHTGQLAEAESIYQTILQRYPDEANAIHLSGVIAYQRGDLQTAIAHYRQALIFKPNYAEIHNNLAVALDKSGDSLSAIAHYQRALTLKPDYAESWQNLGTIYQAQDNFDEALRHYQQALALKPDYADAYNSWASALNRMNRLDEALEQYNQAIAIDPNHIEARCGRAAVLLRQGNLQDGLIEYDWRWLHADCPPRQLPQPAWDGSDFHGKTLLLYAEQGLGDTLQCIRYLPFVRQRGDRVIVELNQPGLERLFAQIPGIDHLITFGQQSLPPFDLQASIMSLPRLFQTTLDTIPADIPYVTVPESVQITLPPAPKSSFNVGVVWTANLLSKTGRERSCSMDLFQQLFDIPGVSFYSLQKQVTDEDQEVLVDRLIPNLGAIFKDLADTAGAIAQLDLVITVDTVVAHLAGALGKPVWVLLPFCCDWRWLCDRTDSPWYPTLRLFRQAELNQWDGVIEAIAEALQQEVVHRAAITASPVAVPTVESPTVLPAAPPNPPQAIGVGWSLNVMTGWGNFGLNLVLQLQQMPEFSPIILTPLDLPDSLNPLHRELLNPVLAEHHRLMQVVAQNPGKQIQVNIPILQALGNRLQGGLANIRSDRNVGVVFLEDTDLPPDAIARGRQFNLIAAGSKWNEQILRSRGLEHTYATPQGIDPTRFHPAPKSNLLAGRFVIFSGGKLEYRKGQDIVVAAFKRFVVRHPDALLITSWHNFWPQFMAGIELMGHVVGVPQVTPQKRLQVKEWLVANGIPDHACIDVGPIPNYLMGQVIREADVAVFPNRCEGGTNLAAMECLACGIPTLLSANTGHLDLIENAHCYPLRSQNPVRPTSQFTGVEGWGESDVDEIVTVLERVYHDRQEATLKGQQAARFMQDWTWEKQIRRLCEVLQRAGLV